MSTHFRHVSEWGQARYSEELGVNLVQFVNQAYLNIGAFQNVTIDQSGAYGGEMSRLRPVDDPRYNEGQVWQAFRKNWVWEDVDYTHSPIYISGVYINGDFQPTTGVGDYAFSINYPDGLIVFDNGIDIDSDVEMEYSYKLVSVYDDRSDWFKNIQYNSQRADSAHFTQYGSGTYDILSQSRVQLPFVVVSPIADVELRPYEVGNHHERRQSVLFHIYAENTWDRNTITDDLVNQKNAILFTFDYNKVLESGVYPLNYNGSTNENGLNYSQLISEGVGYRRRKIEVEDVGAEQLFSDSLPLRSVVRWQVAGLI